MRRASLAILSLALVAAGCSRNEGQQAPSDGAGGSQASAPAAAPAFGAFRQDRLSRDHAGSPAPDLPLETGPDGATTTVADLARAAGTPVLVNLWATWCAPCLKELPTLDRLATDSAGKLRVVALSQDMEGWRAVSKQWEKGRWPGLVLLVESGMAFGAALGARGLPLTILYGPDGREVWRYEGELDWAGAEARALVAADPA